MMKKTIIRALHDPRLLRPAFKDLETWRAWEVYLKALFGLPLEASELEIFRASTGLDAPPTAASRESFCICGRRSGKSFISAAVAVWLACSRDWSKVLGTGEVGWIFVIATDRMQSKIVRSYVEGILRASPAYSRLIRESVQDEVRLTNGIVIAVKTCSFRSVRGFTLLAAILEELAFWRSEESASPDVELLRAVRPALETVPGSLLIGISTPYARSGALWGVFKSFYGKPGSPLVWKAPSLTMNPTLRPESISQAIAEDPEGARAEWLADFRQDISSFIPAELVESIIIPGRQELPMEPGVAYHAFADPSGGSEDSFALAVAHRSSEGRLVLDLLREKRPPFNAQAVVGEFSEILRSYGLNRVRGDRYAGEWPRQAFAVHGIDYEVSEKVSSELFGEVLPLFTSGAVELLDSNRLKSQLSNLERRVRPGGRDAIGHASGAHDDLAVVVAGAILMAARTQASRGRVYICGELVGGPPVETPGPAKRRVFYTKSAARSVSVIERIRESLERGRRPPDD
jgi:hypothetical protein